MATIFIDKREHCNNCNWQGYRTDLKRRSPTTKELDEARKLGNTEAEIEEAKGKKFRCCPECESFDTEDSNCENYSFERQ